jgi:hypothetical protein
MTEAAWQSGNDPRLMLEFLRGKATDRKLRLVAAGAVRNFWSLLLDPASREAVSRTVRRHPACEIRIGARLAGYEDGVL